ncbi:MAG: hypothetical protein AAB296_09460 [Candidatus Desantisbacteria bacterium]
MQPFFNRHFGLRHNLDRINIFDRINRINRINNLGVEFLITIAKNRTKNPVSSCNPV